MFPLASYIFFRAAPHGATVGFASAQLSECLQRCLTPQSVPPGLALPVAPPGLPAPLALLAAALGGPRLPLAPPPPMPEAVDMGVESSPETAEMPAKLGSAEWFPSRVSAASDGLWCFESVFLGG